MECSHLDYPHPRGELLLRGRLFSGYYKHPERTKEVVDSEGWFHTGDVVKLTEGNALSLIGKKTELIKTSMSLVSPEKIELAYMKCPLVCQILVHGEQGFSSLVAIVVPNGERMLSMIEEHQWKGTYEEICQSERLKIEVVKEMKKVEAELAQGERVTGSIFIETKAWRDRKSVV